MREWHKLDSQDTEIWTKKEGKTILEIRKDSGGYCVVEVSKGAHLLGCRKNLDGAKALGDGYLIRTGVPCLT